MMKRIIALLFLCSIAFNVGAENETITVSKAQMEQLTKEHAAALKLLDQQDEVIDQLVKKVRALQAATNCV